MTKYQISTGLYASRTAEFDSREEAWNTLSQEIHENYAVPKVKAKQKAFEGQDPENMNALSKALYNRYHEEDPEDHNIVGTLLEKQEVPAMHGRDTAKRYVPVMRGMIAEDWEETEEEQ